MNYIDIPVNLKTFSMIYVLGIFDENNGGLPSASISRRVPRGLVCAENRLQQVNFPTFGFL